MRPKTIVQITLVMLLAFPLVLSCGQKQAADQTASSQSGQQPATSAGGTTQGSANTSTDIAFAGAERRLVDTLFLMWEKKGHMTSVDQAAKMLGIVVSDSMRAELLKRFNANTKLAEKLGRYHAPTFVLTNQEKLIAQSIIVNERLKSEFPSTKTIAIDVKSTEGEVEARLKFLAELGLLYDLGKPDATNKLGYSFGAELSSFVFDMGLRYHVFYVDDKLPFNVGCAKEALYLIATEFSGNRVRYETFDALTLEPITVVFNQGQVESISSPGARIVEGGTCGQNNLFVSQQNGESWAKVQPRLAQQQTPPIYEIAQRLAQIAELEKQSGSGGK